MFGILLRANDKKTFTVAVSVDSSEVFVTLDRMMQKPCIRSASDRASCAHVCVCSALVVVGGLR